MKRVIASALSYLLIALLVYFMKYLVMPIFPELENILMKCAEQINSFFNINVDPKILSLIIAFVAFVIIFTLLTNLASVARKKVGVVRDNTDSNVRYKSAPFTVVKLILAVIFIALIYGYGKAGISLLKSFTFESKSLVFFCSGFILFTVIWLILWRYLRFFTVFEHELTHMLLALCFLHKPKTFFAGEQEGGWVQLAGVNFIITLGPYFFLTLCFLILPFYFLIKPEFYNYYFLLMGIFTSYHTFSTIRETKFNSQPDILFNGKIFSFVVILLGNIFCYGFILAFVMGGFGKGGEFIQNGWHEAFGLIRMIPLSF